MDRSDVAIGSTDQVHLIKELIAIINTQDRSIAQSYLVTVFQNKIRYQLAGEYGTRFIDIEKWDTGKQMWFYEAIISQVLFEIDLIHDTDLTSMLESKCWEYMTVY